MSSLWRARDTELRIRALNADAIAEEIIQREDEIAELREQVEDLKRDLAAAEAERDAAMVWQGDE